MKHILYHILCTLAIFILIPILFTLLIQGSGKDSIENLFQNSATEAPESQIDEDILKGILANEVKMDTELEAMKAQAVIVRTNCLRAIAKGEDLPEGLTKGEMMRMWGQENFSECYSLLEKSIEATKGVFMEYNGDYIQADFHRCSAGYTRNAGEVYGNEEYPYLKSADCRADIVSEDFLKVMFYTPEEFIKQGMELFREETWNAALERTAEALLANIAITKRDEAGYVTEVTVEGNAHSGEEMRLVYEWNSSAFSFKEVDGKIRVTTKGTGHGLGVSLYTANQLAKDGYSYKDILKYFYQGIEFVTQYD